MNRRSFISFFLSFPFFKFLKFKQESSFIDNFARGSEILGENWVPISKYQAEFFGIPYHHDSDVGFWLGISREVRNDFNTGTSRKKTSF